MPPSATIYAEELQHYGHGHPMWSPEPTKNLDGCERDVQLGDVGHIDEDGCFWRLFNITVASSHEWNGGRVPHGFSPIQIPEHLSTFKEDYLNPGLLASKSVRARTGKAALSASAPGLAELNVSYTCGCSGDRGALLLLEDYASKAAFKKTSLLTNYMLLNHASWHTFATNDLHIDCKAEDIVLVNSTVKTSVWTVVAFTPTSTNTHKVALEGHLGSFSRAGLRFSFEQSTSHTHQCRSGPLHRTLSAVPAAENPASTATDIAGSSAVPVVGTSPSHLNGPHSSRDQCIFLGLYKLKRRKFLPPKLVANADRSFADDGSEGGGPGDVSPLAIEYETESEHILPQSPLDAILDYILEYSNAEVAIACDADINSLPSVSDSCPTYAEVLRKWLPKITLDATRSGTLGQLDTTNVKKPIGFGSPRAAMRQYLYSELHDGASPQAGTSSQVVGDPDLEYMHWHFAKLNTAYPPDTSNGAAAVFYHRIWRTLLDGDVHPEHKRPRLPSELVEAISRLAGLCIPDDDRFFLWTKTCKVRSTDSFEARLWFCTPPFTREEVRDIAAIQLATTSFEQGGDGERTSWSWFEWGFFSSAEEAKRREEGSWETLGWHISHRNRADTNSSQTLEGRIITADDSMWEGFVEGSVLAVRICARFPNTENHARRGEIRYWKWFKPVLWSNA